MRRSRLGSKEASERSGMGELYPFQEKVVDKSLTVQHVLLGMDMGTGKTVVAIDLDKKRRQATLSTALQGWLPPRKLTLVVCPLSVMSMWRDHFAEWNPDLKVIVLDVKDRAAFVAAASSGEYDVYICHWKSLRMMPQLSKIR